MARAARDAIVHCHKTSRSACCAARVSKNMVTDGGPPTLDRPRGGAQKRRGWSSSGLARGRRSPGRCWCRGWGGGGNGRVSFRRSPAAGCPFDDTCSECRRTERERSPRSRCSTTMVSRSAGVGMCDCKRMRSDTDLNRRSPVPSSNRLAAWASRCALVPTRRTRRAPAAALSQTARERMSGGCGDEGGDIAETSPNVVPTGGGQRARVLDARSASLAD